MRLLVIRLNDRAELTFLALDENNEMLEESTGGWRFTWKELVPKINSIIHRFCIDAVVPVVNDWGIALKHALINGKYADRLFRWPPDAAGDWIPADLTGWLITPRFMERTAVDPTSESLQNEEILRKIADGVRASKFDSSVAQMQALLPPVKVEPLHNIG
jgi:hypothetical protein